MNFIKQLNEAINYIENHLEENIDLEIISNITGISKYHFQRIFTAISNISLSEYIRNRKLTKAASEIIVTDQRIIDIALKYGYSSPTSFNRAFKNFHGFSPTELRNENKSIKFFPPIHFSLKISGGNLMDYRILKKDSFNVAGISIPISKKLEENFETVPNFWNETTKNGTLDKFISKIFNEPQGILGVSVTDSDEWRYYIGISTDEPIEDIENLEILKIPEATWAIFSSRGKPTDIQKLEEKILLEWMPSSDYIFDNKPELEIYKNADPENMEFEVWIPVKPKLEN